MQHELTKEESLLTQYENQLKRLTKEFIRCGGDKELLLLFLEYYTEMLTEKYGFKDTREA